MAEKVDPDQALEEIENLHSSATILAEAARLIKNPDVEYDDICNLLKLDQAITAEIIHISNSTFYSLAKPSKDLKTSVSQIGLVEVMKLTGACVSRNLYSRPLKHYGISAEDFWLESISIAIAMEGLANILSERKHEWYTMGILSTIGKSAIDNILDKEEIVDVYNPEDSLSNWEIGHVGFDHTYASAQLLKRWEFPEDIVMAILHILEPTDNRLNPVASKALRLATGLVHTTGVGFNADLGAIRFLPGDIDIPGKTLKEEQIYDMLEEARGTFSELKSSLGIH